MSVIRIDSVPVSARRQSAAVLTQKELQVARLAWMSNRDIAAEIGIAEGTVRTYMDRARIKTGADNRTHLYALVMKAEEERLAA